MNPRQRSETKGGSPRLFFFILSGVDESSSEVGNVLQGRKTSVAPHVRSR